MPQGDRRTDHEPGALSVIEWRLHDPDRLLGRRREETLDQP
jgi:hypothetical protein